MCVGIELTYDFWLIHAEDGASKSKEISDKVKKYENIQDVDDKTRNRKDNGK